MKGFDVNCLIHGLHGLHGLHGFHGLHGLIINIYIYAYGKIEVHGHNGKDYWGII
jgi:hypothetical protein